MPLSFLAPAALFAALAVAVPIAIHLLQRRREATVDFPAVRFLLLAQRRSARRLRLRRLLLLALRCLAVLLPALALARPVLDAPGAGGGAARRTVVLLDTSLSLEARGPARTRFEQARSYAAALAEGAGPESRFALVEAAEVPGAERPARWLDPAAYLEALAAGRTVPAVADPARAFGEAYRLLAGGGAGDARIIVVTDLARGGWEAFSLAAVPGFDARVPLRVVRAGGDAAANRAGIVAVSARGESLVAGEAREIAAEIVNQGPGDTIPVELWVDGALAATRIETVRPGSVARSVFEVRLAGGGAHRAELRLPGDRYPPDDRRGLGLEALPPVGVLLVDGDPGASLPEGESFFLQEALRPGLLSPERALRVRVAGPDALAGPLPGDTDVVVLANVRAPAPAGARTLAQFVAAGGGLALFWGGNVDGAAWRAALPGLLPAEPRGTERAPAGERPFRVGTLDYEAPALAVFRPPGGGTFATASFGARAAFGVPAQAARVLARFEDGAPWILEQPVGRGRVLLVGSTADLAWNDLPLRPVFVPLVQRLVLALAGSLGAAADAETVAGEARVFAAGPEQAGTGITVTAPDGVRSEVVLRPEGEGVRALFRGTAVPGFYDWSRPGAAGVFAVNPPRAESDLAPLADAELAARFAPARPELVALAPGEGEDAVVRAGARSLERPLLLALLAVLLLEAAIALPRRGRARPEEGGAAG